MNEAPVKVLVVEDQVLMRRGLVKLLESEADVEVVGEAEDGLDALGKVPRLRPEVALVDARMPRMDGVAMIGHLSEGYPEVAAIVLTTFDDDEYIFGGLRAGARGYLLKDTPPDELVAAIRKVRRGETVLGAPAAARVVSELNRSQAGGQISEAGPSADERNPLSGREFEVVALVGAGATNEEISRALFVSEGTAKNHVSKILRKLDLRDRTQLALYAAERGWTEKASLTQIKRIYQDPSDSGQRKD